VVSGRIAHSANCAKLAQATNSILGCASVSMHCGVCEKSFCATTATANANSLRPNGRAIAKETDAPTTTKVMANGVIGVKSWAWQDTQAGLYPDCLTAR